MRYVIFDAIKKNTNGFCGAEGLESNDEILCLIMDSSIEYSVASLSACRNFKG